LPLLILFSLFISSFISCDRSIESAFANLRGEELPDSNIIIIHVDEKDIENLGPWPIKRSYYALLINNLSKLDVKKIGLEVFLSSRFSSQAVYDNLLTREIERSGSIVLSSLAGEIKYDSNNNIYTTDSLSYPSPKLINENFLTGHINYIEDNGIKIPIELKANNEIEFAFFYQLANEDIARKKNDAININFISSWKKFQNYSLQAFFELVNSGSPALASFKNKIIIIGISDPQIAAGIKTYFEDGIPGIALHAFAVDNFLNQRYLKEVSPFLSGIISLILLAAFILYQKKLDSKKLIISYAAMLIVLLLIFFMLFAFFYFRFSYMVFFIPIFLLALIDVSIFIYEKQIHFEGVAQEKELLEIHLKKKETELQKLQSEMKQLGAENSEQIIAKIKLIQNDIERLKNKEEDEAAAEIKDEKNIQNFYGIIYRSKIMGKVADLIRKAAPEEANILILGESGTGKELAARAVHELSKRKDKKFIAVNCGALVDTLLESELFGHVKGAFTGAAADKIGRFEAADKGTIFLDEIAETSENFQVKLLRILQSGEYERVGSSTTSKADVRIVAATNKILEDAVKEKKFREDLYYRLNVIKIELPSLRERKEDIEILAESFVKKDSDKIKISKAALDALVNNDWKGNVRELEAVMQRAVIFCKSAGRELIQLADLPDEIVKKVKYNFEDLVLDSLREKKFSHSSINETAAELGNVSRTIISENFRGIFFKNFVENNFDVEKAVSNITMSDDEDVRGRVRSKGETFLNNIKKDLQKFTDSGFESIKATFSSKYKNLPQKFHLYLDEIIKKYID
jgi:DNA-binding NtrC family response regulator/CHASE2 domain-containing sensor protein